MDYRLSLTVPGLPLGAERSHEAIADALAAAHDVVSPVLDWHGDDLDVEIGLDASSEASAVQRGVEVLDAALHDCGFGSRYPSRVEVELLDRAQRQLQLA